MEKREKLDNQIDNLQKLNSSDLSVEAKLDELITLLENSNLDSESVNQLKSRFNTAVDNASFSAKSLKDFEKLDNSTASRLELADNLEVLLSQYQLDSKVSKKILLTERLLKATKLIIGIILITLGFSMIIMPAPPYFEMFTIFYFSLDDGVTLMDLISLLIVFTGVYLFISSIIKVKHTE